MNEKQTNIEDAIKTLGSDVDQLSHSNEVTLNQLTLAIRSANKLFYITFEENHKKDLVIESSKIYIILKAWTGWIRMGDQNLEKDITKKHIECLQAVNQSISSIQKMISDKIQKK